MITLSKHEIRYITDHYNPDCEDYVDKKVDSLIPYLNQKIILSEDYTLSDLFRLLDKEVDAYNVIFCSYMGGCSLEDYIEDINKEVCIEKIDDSLDYLEVYWNCYCEDYRKRWPEENFKKEIVSYTGFSGWGTYKDTNFTEGFKGYFAIEFSPLAKLKHLPLKIKTTTKIYFENGDIKDKADILFEGEKSFSVFDFLSAILDEISFAGDPKQRDDYFKNLKSDIKEMKANINLKKEQDEEFNT